MRWFERWNRARRSIVGRLFISHIIVGALTTLLIALSLGILIAFSTNSLTPADYASYAENSAIAWLMPKSTKVTDVKETATINFLPPGYSLVVSSENRVQYVERDSPCRVGMVLADCAPYLLESLPGESFIQIYGEQWVEIVLPLSTGDRVIARLASPTPTNIISWLQEAFPNMVIIVLQLTIIVSLISIPASALLVLLFARPVMRRISQIARISQKFADGELTARVHDPKSDEVGYLAQQFDTMADSLQQNIFVLRDLLKANATLAFQAEAATVQSERLRLARDLHDDFAQRLFSLTVSTAALPELIERDSNASVIQARQIALLAERTLVGLRSFLFDLRPSGVVERGLVSSLKLLCIDWEKTSGITPDLSIMISSNQFAMPLQTALCRIMQESLNNITKHAHANQVVVSLVEGRQQIVLSISDNGRGFALHSSTKGGHFGLLNIRERAEALGGTLYIESETGRGTTIRVVLPLHSQV